MMDQNNDKTAATAANTTDTTKAAEKKRRDEERLRMTQEGVGNFLEQHPDLYYVKKNEKFIEYSAKNNVWEFFSTTAMRQAHGCIRQTLSWEILLTLMEEHGRIKKRVGFSPRLALKGEDDPETLNRFRRDGWLLPNPNVTPNAHCFDLLLRALGNESPEKMQHLKEVIGWKYLHPEETQLPCLVFFGQGGIGKNLLVDTVLRRIFGGATISIAFDKVSRFNTSIAEKFVVNFDEAEDGKRIDAATLKTWVNNQYLQVEGKGVDVYDADNVALYMASSNDDEGSFKLEGNDADRRYSVMRAEKSMAELLSRDTGVTVDEARNAINQMATGVFKDDAEVGYFLWQCVEAVETLAGCPKSLRGADYEELLATQAGAEGEIFDEVFNDPDFKCISYETLYELYQQRQREVNTQGGIKKQLKLNFAAKKWIARKGLKVVATKEQLKRGGKLRKYFYREGIDMYELGTTPELDGRTKYLSSLPQEGWMPRAKEEELRKAIHAKATAGMKAKENEDTLLRAKRLTALMN